MSSGRARTIKPEILEDAITAGLSDTAFRLFIACIVSADDYGNFRAEPKLIEKDVYWTAVPERSVELAMAELAPLVHFYTVRGQRYGHIKNWEKHQYIQRPGKPRVPGPSEAFNENCSNNSQHIPTESKTVRTDQDLDQEIEREQDLDRARGAPVSVVSEVSKPDQKSALSQPEAIWLELWEARYRRPFVWGLDTGPRGDTSRLWALFRAAESEEKYRHWVKRYLADKDPFVADKSHPIHGFTAARVNDYGGPSKAPKPPPESTTRLRSDPSPKPVSIAATAEFASKLAGIGRGGS